MTNVTPMLIFLPGLGADHRLFKHQTAAFSDSLAADWIDPLPDERLEQYAVRLAESIRAELDTRPLAPVVVCGLSLGGMIAPYVARHLDAAGCVLLCSIRGPKEFPRRYYFDWWLLRHCFPLRLARLFMLQLGARCLLLFPGLLQKIVSPKIVRQFAETPTRRLAGLASMMFDWAYRRREEPEKPPFAGPTGQIHGTRDLLLPIRLTHPDIRIPSGGHLLALSHPEEVNEFIEQFVAEFAQKNRNPEE